MIPKSSKPASSQTNDLIPERDESKDKRTRILDAAQNLFVRYGVKRTSIDDIVRETGIAKGTFYLYYESKDALFAAIAERMCMDILDHVYQAMALSAPLTERLVGVLDANIGFMHRLVAESPYMAELTESKEALAATTFATFDQQFRNILAQLLRDSGIRRADAGDMFLAAAMGTLKTGEISEDLYRMRLKGVVEILILGLRVGATDETAKRSI